MARSGRVSQTKEERYSYQHWVAGGGRVGSWPTRLSSISISREQGHQQNCVQRRSEEAEKGQDGNEPTIGLSTKSDHVSREQCHFDHQPVLPTELNQPGDSDENTLVFCRAVVLEAAPWSACLEFVQNPVGSLVGGCTTYPN